MHFSWKIFRALAPLAIALAVLAGSHATAQADQNVAAAQVACGSVDLGTASSTDADAAFSCFAKAFTHCDYASLTATSTDSGAPVSSTFTTYAGDRGCNISETVTRNSGSDADVDSFICNGVTQDGDALHFTGCGTQRDVWLRLSKS
ncbi:MAG TPA: hypothetical protein VEJ41_01375 [Candidatus Acidoferrales bacterium]|nr:hypothetical protein [Candidatus Acidoferrales bacterium]